MSDSSKAFVLGSPVPMATSDTDDAIDWSCRRRPQPQLALVAYCAAPAPAPVEAAAPPKPKPLRLGRYTRQQQAARAQDGRRKAAAVRREERLRAEIQELKRVQNASSKTTTRTTFGVGFCDTPNLKATARQFNCSRAWAKTLKGHSSNCIAEGMDAWMKASLDKGRDVGVKMFYDKCLS